MGHVKEPTGTGLISPLLEKLKSFGLDLSHLDKDKLEAGETLQKYFFLDLANVLVDCLYKVKQDRLGRELRTKLESEVKLAGQGTETSGGEEVARILGEARKKYGRIQSFRGGLDAVDISMIQPKEVPRVIAQKVPQVIPQQIILTKGVSDRKVVSEDTSEEIERKKVKQGKRKVDKQRTLKENVMITDDLASKDKGESGTENVFEEVSEDINLVVPTSDTTDVVIKVKPLTNKDLNNKRIHIRINEKKNPESKSKKIVYGSKSLVSHHLRKSRPPLFSKKLASPKLDKKELISKAIDEVKRMRDNEERPRDKPVEKVANKELDMKLHCQRVIREKRTKNAQLRKMLNNI